MFKSTTFTFLEKYAVLGFTAVLFLISFNSVYAFDDFYSPELNWYLNGGLSTHTSIPPAIANNYGAYQGIQNLETATTTINSIGVILCYDDWFASPTSESVTMVLADSSRKIFATSTDSVNATSLSHCDTFSTTTVPLSDYTFFSFDSVDVGENYSFHAVRDDGGTSNTFLPSLMYSDYATTSNQRGFRGQDYDADGVLQVSTNYDSWIYYQINSSTVGTSTSNYDDYFDCDTCTRIISHEPYTDEVLASTTSGYMVSADVYVNADDLGLGNDGYIQFWLSPPLSDEVHKSSPIPIESLDTTETYLYYYNSSYISATGTYTMSIHVVDEGFYWDNDIRNTYFSFALGTENTATETQAYYETSRANDFETENYIEGIIEEPGKLALLIDDVFSDFIHLPPFGYVVIFVETMQNGTSTALDDLTMGFASSSPLAGTTISLDIAGGFEQAIQTIRDEGVNGENGDSFDTFMYYWELMFYIAFAFWLVKELLGLSMVGSFGYSGGDTEQLRYHKKVGKGEITYLTPKRKL